MRRTWLERREVVRLLAVKGKYDGEVVRLLQPVQASAGTEVIITFLDEAAESWIHRLPSQIKASSLSDPATPLDDQDLVDRGCDRRA
jgi:hypothetical protein